MENTTEITQEVPTSDERLLAMFSHFSIFLGGIILPIIMYFVKKDKSKFVAFHALQSIFFHLMYLIIIFALVFFLIIVMLLTGVFSIHHSHDLNHSGAGFFMGMIMFYMGIGASAILAISYGIYMGIKANEGGMKKYFLVGEWAYRKVYGR
ncbi:MAG: DUF4870 domain-containing protein [Bacteroidetes bacterium]|nr:DUF4870 domain-containing protein [Bacteroidota bacterium]